MVKKSQKLDYLTVGINPCPICHAKSTYKTVATTDSCFWEGGYFYLLRCEHSNCEGNAWSFCLNKKSELKYGKTKWFKPKSYVPPDIATEYKESCGCFEHGYYNAACVMSRRLLERVLIAKGANPNKSVSDMIKQLVKSGLLDRRLKSLCDKIKFLGNTGAHNKVETANQEDAEMVLQYGEFLIARLYGDFKEVNPNKARHYIFIPTETD